MDQDMKMEEQKKENAESEEQSEGRPLNDADLEKVTGGMNAADPSLTYIR